MVDDSVEYDGHEEPRQDAVLEEEQEDEHDEKKDAKEEVDDGPNRRTAPHGVPPPPDPPARVTVGRPPYERVTSWRPMAGHLMHAFGHLEFVERFRSPR